MDAQELYEDLLSCPAVRDSPRVAMAFANCFGGWTFGEPQLRRLASGGSRSLSPHQAVAWFPAAAQGRTTIRFGAQCPAVTFSTEAVAFYDALTMCQWWLDSDVCDIALACAAESSGSRFLHRAIGDGGEAHDSCVWWALDGSGKIQVTLGRAEGDSPRSWPSAEPFEGVSPRGATMLPLVALRALDSGPRSARVHDQFAVEVTGNSLNVLRLDELNA